MATKEKTKSVSYQRKRDYTNGFTWTYELNQDVFQCYKKARENPSIGYMKRLKLYWDDMHPELQHFNEKQLRQQASFVEKKGLTLESNLRTDISNTESIPEIDEHPEEIVHFDLESREIPHIDEPIDQDLFNEIDNKFLHYFDIYKNVPLAQRNYLTPVTYAIKKGEWDVMNSVIHDFISSKLDEMNLWNLNVIQYASVITLL